MFAKSSENNTGVIALSTILLIGGVIVEIGIVGLLISYFLTQGSFGIGHSAKAMAAAQFGIQDAIIKIDRDKEIDYITSGSPYSLTINSQSAQVIICKDLRTISTACDTPNSGKHEIISLGISKKKQHKIQVIVNVNSKTGKVYIESIEEIAI